MTKNILELEEATFRYPDGSMGLDRCSLALERGSRTVVLGVNGAGKTTLFLHLNGILRPQEGQARLDGKPLDYGRSGLRELRSRIGLVFQDPDAQLFSASVREDISFGPVNLGLSREAVRSRVEEALEAVGLTGQADRPVHLLSYGQKKRACIAGVLAMRPEVMLLDEPTAGLDTRAQQELLEILEQLHGQGITIALATHDIDLAYGWADHACVLEGGRAAAQCAAAEFPRDFPSFTRYGLGLPRVAEMHRLLLTRGLVPLDGRPPRSHQDVLRLLQPSPSPTPISRSASPDDPDRRSFLPLSVNIEGRLCVVVGGGRVAMRKARRLEEHGAHVRIVAPASEPIADDDSTWVDVEVVRHECQPEDLAHARLVIAATSDPSENHMIACIARGMGLMVLRVDAPEESDFHVPAALSAGDLTVSFSTNGASPGFAARLRDEAATRYGPAHAEFCRPESKRLDVSKRKGKCERTQDEIIAILIQEAKLGRVVARLKGGDPLVFGRGGEEARALRRAGVPFEIVPGVSSVTAVPAYAGIPVTDRDYSSSFAAYSAHRKGGLCLSDVEWRRIAQGPDTLVFLMGKTRCDQVAQKLVEFGRSAVTPVALIFNGTTPTQQTVVGTLGSIASRVQEMDVPGPGLIVVGDVVNAMPAMTWFEEGEAT